MKRNIEKYTIIKDSRGVWIARVPHGTYNSFVSRAHASAWVNRRIKKNG
jgi:hypothetical protein